MNKYQLTIQDSIIRCVNALERYDKALAAYGAEKSRISTQPWLEDEKDRQRSKALETLSTAAQSCHQNVFRELETIENTAVEMENIFELSPELQAAINLVSATGSALSWDTRQHLVASFVGQKQALIALCSIFEAKGIKTEEVKGYIFDAATHCKALNDTAYRLVSQPGSNIGVVLTLAKELEVFAKLEGIELSSKFTSENQAAYLTARTREAMGLPVT